MTIEAKSAVGGNLELMKVTSSLDNRPSEELLSQNLRFMKDPEFVKLATGMLIPENIREGWARCMAPFCAQRGMSLRTFMENRLAKLCNTIPI